MWNGLVNRLGAFWNSLRPLDPQMAVLQTISPQFVPYSTPDFPPLRAMLSCRGEPFPVIIEGADVAHARRVLEGDLHRELETFLSATRPFEAVPWLALVRDLEGGVEGIALSWLVGRGPHTRMKCERVRKRVFDGDDCIKNVGLALLLAQLRWMKQNGYWPYRGEILTEYDPSVMASYRRTCGMEPGFFDQLTISTASVHRSSGEEFLERCPFSMAPLPPR